MNEALSSNRNKYQTTVEHELSYVEANRIADTLSELSSAQTYEGMYGLEVVDDEGVVELLRLAKTEAKEGEVLKTVLSRVPLVQYEEGGVVHDITLYSRKTTGYYHEMGGPEDTSLFVIDQSTDEEGVRHLAATPGLLYRSDERGVDDSQLTMAVLEGLGGAEGLEKLLQARQDEDEATVSRLESELTAALHHRGFERSPSLREFSERYWTAEKRVVTYEEAEERRAAYEKRQAEEARQWNEMSPVRKLGVWAAWRLGGSGRYTGHRTAQDAYMARKRR